VANLYSGRRAKAIQRHMIVDACRRLTHIAPLSDYQYVGFGGLEFNDFVDFHNALGISRMTSIEHDTMLTHRVEFNKPYATVDVRMGEARDILSQLDWSQLSITWLDYVDPLTSDALRDVDFVVRSALPGSVLIVTVLAEAGALAGRAAALRDNLQEHCPAELSEEEVKGWGVATVQRGVLQATANSVAREARKGSFRQQFNFTYADGARMQTWGGLISAPNVDRVIDGCGFSDLDYVRPGSEALHVRVPDFTEREWLHFEKSIHSTDRGIPALKGVDRTDVDAFADVYRWKAS